MKPIGERHLCSGIDDLQDVGLNELDRPTEMPQLPPDHVLVAIYRRRADAIIPGGRETSELVVICQTFADVQGLWEDHHKGYLHFLRFGSTDSEVSVTPQPPES